MPLKAINWGRKHPNVLVRLYTYSCFVWFIVVFGIWIDVFSKKISVEPTVATALGYVIALLIMGLFPMIPLYLLYYFRARPSTQPIPPTHEPMPTEEPGTVRTPRGDQKIRLIELANPMLENAIHSLSNALEFFQKEGERYRQAVLIEMDQAVEYILKAFLFQINSNEFIRKDWEHMDYDKAMVRVEQCGVTIAGKSLLKKAHKARNDAQHRGVIASTSWTRFHIKNIYKFLHQFCLENFDLDINYIIPMKLRLGFYKEASKSEEISESTKTRSQSRNVNMNG